MRTLPAHTAWRYDLIRFHMAPLGNCVSVHPWALDEYSELDSLIVLDS